MWSPMVSAAAVASGGRFSLALGELEYDSPFSAILSYDPRLSQPWSRVDVEREIVDLTYRPFGQAEHVPTALSNEGDVYTLGDVPVRDKIPGAGVLSDDADGRGAVWRIVWAGGTIWVIGESGQLWSSKGGTWTDHGPVAPDFTHVDLASVGEHLVLLAQTRARRPQIDYEAMTSPEAILEMMQVQAEDAETNRPLGALFAGLPANWSRVALDTAPDVSALQAGPDGSIHICGVAGLLLTGTLSEGVTEVDLGGVLRSLRSVAGWGGHIWVTTDTGLHTVESSALSTVSLDLPMFVSRGVPSPFGLRAAPDRLTYFDNLHDPHEWDGETWRSIPIPPVLRQREFVPGTL